MGQGTSTNKQQPQKSDSVEQVESVESNEDDDISRKGSLKKNKWLRPKLSDDKPKKNKKSDKKKKKKDDQEEVSSATCITESDRASLRHSRIELHLEECQPAPDEDDAISLSSCGEDPQKNLKNIENEEPPSLLNCDYSSSTMTASPGESMSSGQDSGFARGNTIHSMSSEEGHTETNHQHKENSSGIGTKLITPTVEVTEKCKDYIEKSYPFNSCSPINSPANSIVEDQTKKDTDDNPAESNLRQENTCDTVSTSTVPSPELETQSSITETPKIASQTEVMKDSDLVTGMVKELVDETVESAVEFLTHEYKRRNNKSELNEVNQQESISQDNKVEEKIDKELYLTEVTETSGLEEKSKEINESHVTLSDTLPEPLQDKVSGEGIDNKETAASNCMEKTEVNATTEEDVIVTNKEVTDSLNQELRVENCMEKTEVNATTEEDVIVTNKEVTDSLNQELRVENCMEKAEVNATTEEDVIVTNKEITDSLNQELRVEDISVETVCSTDSINVDNDEIIEKSGQFEELSYSLQVKPVCLEENQTEESEDKSEKDANEVEALQNCDSIVSDYSLLSTESASSEDNSMKVEVSESVSFNSQLKKQNSSDSEVLVETIQKEEARTVSPSDILMTTDLDAEDSGINNSGESLPSFSSDLSDASMTENSKSFKDTSSFQLSTPEIITINEFQNNCTDSSAGSATSPQPSKESKEITEQTPSSMTQPIPDNTIGAVFV